MNKGKFPALAVMEVGFYVQAAPAQCSSIWVVVSLYFTWPSFSTKF